MCLLFFPAAEVGGGSLATRREEEHFEENGRRRSRSSEGQVYDLQLGPQFFLSCATPFHTTRQHIIACMCVHSVFRKRVRQFVFPVNAGLNY